MAKEAANHKKRLKDERVRSFFIQAAKEIIIDEGVENVSVRKVAEQAGYTFATIYNHFKDLDEILQNVKISMILDVVNFMKDRLPEKTYDLVDIKRLNRLYAEYYLDRRNIFRFFYSYRLQPASQQVELPDFEPGWLMTYRGFVESGAFSEAEILLISKTMIYALHGLLMLYFAGYGMTKDALFSELDTMTEYLLGGRN